MQHTDDSGELSIFISGEEVLFACNKGHAWRGVVSAVGVSEGDLESADLSPRGLGAGGIAQLVEQFGAQVREAMGLGD
jgi:hypothetical protein